MLAVATAAALTVIVLSPRPPTSAPGAGAPQLLAPAPLAGGELPSPGSVSAPPLRAIPLERGAPPVAPDLATVPGEGAAAPEPAAPVPTTNVLPAPPPEPLSAAVPSLATTVICGHELVALEPLAVLGKLDTETLVCLEQEVVSGANERAKVSAVLMANAWANRDNAEWERLVERHLRTISGKDPDLCYKFALYLSRKGPERAADVVHWSERALERRTIWTGDVYTNRVATLYKVRAAASQKLWSTAEQAHDSAAVRKHRAQTGVHAREWYEFAEASGVDSSLALRLCKSADPSCEP